MPIGCPWPDTERSMADNPTGFPGKTARLNRGGSDDRPIEDDPSASGSSIEMVISEDMGKMIAGRYEITDVIGEGGMGVVYEAYDTQVERNVAIKLVRAESARPMASSSRAFAASLR